ncbi:YcxB family protein [Streptomyces sp. NPDC055103]
MVMESGRNGIQETVELVYRPTRDDILTAALVRERVKRLHILRWCFTLLFGGVALLLVAAQRTFTMPIALAALWAVLIWAMPRLQARRALRTAAWQGEYRASVSEEGITAANTHVTFEQRWSFFRGYRETRDHVVLLSRDPNTFLVEVLPKRGLSSPEDTERLLDLLNRHLTRV